jgi:hypothetical protein
LPRFEIFGLFANKFPEMQTAIYTNPTSKQKYRTLKELGKGQFGLVQLCQIQNPNFERDIKSYSTEE